MCVTQDGDGRCELVVGYTDRVVRAFRWEEPSDSSDVGPGQLILLKKWLLEGQVSSGGIHVERAQSLNLYQNKAALLGMCLLVAF